jgi:hypothetical protein
MHRFLLMERQELDLLPLIDSIPYVKDYLDHEHPQPGNPEAAFIAGIRKSLTRKLQPTSIYKV